MVLRMSATKEEQHSDQLSLAQRSRYAFLVAVIPTGSVVLQILLAHPRRLYTSDATAQQSIVRTWYDVGHDLTFVPRDTWALKVPLYLALEKLSLPPLDKLLIAVLVFNLVTFLMLGRAIWKLVAGTTAGARWYEAAVPLAWVTTVPGGISGNRMMPNYRNVELGLTYLMLALVAGYLGELAAGRETGPAGTARRSGISARMLAVGVVSAVLLGVLGFDDPYIALLVTGPLAVAAVGWYLLRERDSRLLQVAAVLAASFPVTTLLRTIAGALGVRFDDTIPSLAISPADLSLHLGLVMPATNLALGSDRWDRDPPDLLAQTLVLVVTVALLVATAALARYGWRHKLFVLTFISLHWPLVLAGFMVSWHTQDRSAGRYLVLAVFDLMVATAVLLPRLRLRRPALATALVGLITASTVISLSTGVATAIDVNSRPYYALEHQQAMVQAIDRAVDEHGAVKGYGPFWTANVSSYMVGRKTTAVEIVCREHRLRTRQWLSDTARLNRPATAVFLIWDPQELGRAGCTAADRDAQLGTPIATYPLAHPPVPTPGGGVVAVLVYSPDIAARLRY
jgi:hypothetical protein